MASPQTGMHKVTFDRVFKQVLPVESSRVVTDCFVIISKLVQMQVKLLPVISPSLALEVRQTSVILQKVKSSVRTLSEDVWSVFQTVTNIMKYEDWPENRQPPGEHDILEYHVNPHLTTLCLQLDALETRLKDMSQASYNYGDHLTDTVSGQLLLEHNPPEGVNMVFDAEELKMKTRDAYKAAEELGAYSGMDCPLRCLSKVLSELDALVALMEKENCKVILQAGNADLWTDTEKASYTNSIANNPNTDRIQSGIGDKKADDKCNGPVVGTEKKDEDPNDSGTNIEPVREKPNEKLIRRGKFSDTLVRSTIDGVEVVQVESVPDRKRRPSKKKKKSAKPRDSSTSCQSSEASTMSEDSLQLGSTASEIKDIHRRDTSGPVEGSDTSVYDRDSIQEVSKTADETRLKTVSNYHRLPASSTDSIQDDYQEFHSSNGSQCDGEPKRRISEAASIDEQILDNVSCAGGVENAVDLDRRSSLTDLHVDVDERVVPHPSVAQWDMMPTLTTSCPDIPSSTSLQSWSGHPISNQVHLNQTCRQKGLTKLVFCSLTFVLIMAIIHIAADFTGIPIADNLRVLITDYLALLSEDVSQRVHHIQSLIKVDGLFIDKP